MSGSDLARNKRVPMGINEGRSKVRTDIRIELITTSAVRCQTKRLYGYDIIIYQLIARSKTAHFREMTTRQMVDRSCYKSKVMMIDKAIVR